jgi:hypothetical protein
MITLVIYLNVLIFVLLSALHFYWAFGGKWALASSVPELTNKKPLFNPGIFGSLFIAFGLLIFAFITYFQLDIFSILIGEYIDYATVCIALIFFIRAIGDFRYVGLFKKIKGTPFAINDSKIYIPLCLYLSLSSCLIVIL